MLSPCTRPIVPAIAVRHDRLGGARAGDRLRRVGDVVERLVPAHRRETAAALAADALQRLQDAIGMVRALGVARDLGASAPCVGGWSGSPWTADRPAVLDGDEHRAGVGAVVRTGGADDWCMGISFGPCVQTLWHSACTGPDADGLQLALVASLPSHASHRIHPRRRRASDRRAIRRDIHAHPELCFEEQRTSDLVAEQLTSGASRSTAAWATTGVVGHPQERQQPRAPSACAPTWTRCRCTEHNTLRAREHARRQDARLRPRRPHRDAAGARPSTWRSTATSTARST